MHILEKIRNHLGNRETLFIQTHNFPDHDAVASGYALKVLFEKLGVESRLIYEGEIQRNSLHEMINALNIPIEPGRRWGMTDDHMIVIVDGCKGNKNVTDLIGNEIAVIDHHQVKRPDDVPFSDIRPSYGACSTILAEYYRDFDVEMPRRVATALMLGINTDTALLTRGVSEADIQVYSDLYLLSDVRLQNTILRNYIQTKDLRFYRYLLDNMKIFNGVAYSFFPQGCNQNLLGILGDFLLALEEVDFVILGAQNGDKVNYSLRSEKEEWNAAAVVQQGLKGIGFGGGHIDMAGGIIHDIASFNEDSQRRRFLEILGIGSGG